MAGAGSRVNVRRRGGTHAVSRLNARPSSHPPRPTVVPQVSEAKERRNPPSPPPRPLGRGTLQLGRAGVTQGHRS